ncbi:hypothetical protein ACTVZO_42145 [Streptomyces sp. IBSNAI002]|uniref:hypothetical protein n=1 Tax=Streptomyces sp. IBSNAI002 TaxID=3457500 RepID=UPI003FCFEDD7
MEIDHGCGHAEGGPGPVSRTSSSPQQPAARRSRRSLLIWGGIPVVLLGALVVGTRMGSGETQTPPGSVGTDPAVSAPAPPGVHTREGARAVAGSYAEALSSERMFSDSGRTALMQDVYTPDALAKVGAQTDAQYKALARKMGIDGEGRPPAGEVFVHRAEVKAATLLSYGDNRATVAVECSGAMSLTGPEPYASTSRFVMTFSLVWTMGADGETGWRAQDVAQVES